MTKVITPVSVNFEFTLHDIEPTDVIAVFGAWIDRENAIPLQKPDWLDESKPKLVEAWDYFVAREMYDFVLRGMYSIGKLSYPKQYFEMYELVYHGTMAETVSLEGLSPQEVDMFYHIDVMLTILLPSVTDKAFLVREIITSVADVGDVDPIAYMFNLLNDFAKLRE